jgi:hypothetical protein
MPGPFSLALDYGDGILAIGLVIYLPGGTVYICAGISFGLAPGSLNVAFLLGPARRWLQRWLVFCIRRGWVLLVQNGVNYNELINCLTSALLINNCLLLNILYCLDILCCYAATVHLGLFGVI